MTDFSQILMREVGIEKSSFAPQGGASDDKSSSAKATEDKLKERLPIKQKIKDAPKTPSIAPVDKKSAIKKIKVLKKGKRIKKEVKKKERSLELRRSALLSREAINPVWLSLFETAKLGGIDKKTLKRAIRNDLIKYKIVDNRYYVDFRSAILYLAGKKRLWNKLREFGIGQYVEKWIE
jgi:hypothetical protein